MKESHRHLGFVDIFYGIAAIQIVFVHARMMRIENPAWVKWAIRFISRYHMALFFFISGLLLSYTINRHDNLWVWFKKKLKKLGFPFLILSLIALIPKILLEPILKNGASFSLEYFATVLFYPRKYVWGHFWFIPVYLIIMLFCYWIHRRFRNEKYIWALILIVACVFGCYPIAINWFGIKDICRFTIYVLIGITVEPVMSRSVEGLRKRKTRSFIYAVIVFAAALTLNEVLEHTLVHFVISILMIICFLLTSIILDTENTRIIDIIRKIGKKNLTIYIYSWPAQAIVEIVLTHFTRIDINLVFIIKLIIGIAIPMLISMVFHANNKMVRMCDYLGL